MLLNNHFCQACGRHYQQLQRGFTLLEILIVLGLIGMISAFIVPSLLAGRNHYLLAEETRTIASALRYTRSLAISSQSDQVLLFDLAEKTVTTADGRETTIDPAVTLDILTSEAEVSGDQVGIRFYPDGASTGGRVTLTVNEESQAVDVVWMTGQVNTFEVFDGQ